MKAGAKKKGGGKRRTENKGGAPSSSRQLKVERFVAEYLVCYEGKEAAIRAGYAPASAKVTACKLLADPAIKARIRAANEAITAKLEMTTQTVLERWTAVATADPRELTELHRGACRYCWGKDNRYQRTPQEMRDARAQFDAWLMRKKKADPSIPDVEFDEQGGKGFNPKKDPNPDCPECFGDGEERIVFKDTRDLSPAARMLYAGVERTQRGLKVRTHSQPAALANIARHYDMFKPKEKPPGDGDMADALRKARERAGIR